MIALLTDFHTSDGLGLVKAVMKSINPKAELVDLYNYVEPYQVKSGAWVLLQDYSYFPKATVFYCVVDPGVGGARKAIAVKTKNYFFVGPDNGLMYPAASRDGIELIVELDVTGSSKTFQGRDVFAPAAAKLDKGDKIKSLGKELSQLQQLDVSSSGDRGEVVVIEHYGNIVTNIPAGSAEETYYVECGDFKKNLKFHDTFSAAGEGELFVIKGSRNTLELSVKEGPAAGQIQCKVGDKIKIK